MRAPGAGRVVAARGDVPDNRFDGPRVVQGGELSLDDPASFAGNYVILDHGNGEFSELAHLRRGSVRVRVGERVVRGQPVGEVGFSGSTGDVVHLHYELRDRAHVAHAEGLPSRFARLRRVGEASGPRDRAQAINTGDVVESFALSAARSARSTRQRREPALEKAPLRGLPRQR